MLSLDVINKPSINQIQSEKLQNINEQLKDLPKVLDKDTLEKLRNGEYEISLEEYTDMNSYRIQMTSLYGDYSANNFNSILNNTIGKNSNDYINAKEFVAALKDKGISSKAALNLHTALKSYSLISGIENKNYSFIHAKI